MPNPKAVLLTCLFALGPGSASGVSAAQPACPRVGFAVVQPQPSAQTRTVAFQRGRIHIDRTPVTAMDDIAAVRLDKGYEASAVVLTFRPEGAARLETATTNHSGLRLAFVFDDEALMAVTWQGPYGMGAEGAQISMRDQRRAAQVVSAIERCLAARAKAPAGG